MDKDRAPRTSRPPLSGDVEGLLARFVAWRDRVQDGENGTNYLNGEKPPFGNGDDGWEDLDRLAEEARAALATPSAGIGEEMVAELWEVEKLARRIGETLIADKIRAVLTAALSVKGV